MKALTVYLIEDSSVVRNRLVSLLADIDGVEVIGQAVRATEALIAIRQWCPNLVLLALPLAHASGLELLRQIKRQPVAPFVLVLSDNADRLSRKTSLKAGADFFFDKSFQFDQALDLVQRTVSWEPSAEKNSPGSRPMLRTRVA